jgi:hypothetical protein
MENQITYAAKVLRKISTQGIRSMSPSKAATDDFVTYCDAFFPRTNLVFKCSSWANGRRPGARIHGFWPGSSAHLTLIRREPRWEDWEYELIRPENRFAYWGNGKPKCYSTLKGYPVVTLSWLTSNRYTRHDKKRI